MNAPKKIWASKDSNPTGELTQYVRADLVDGLVEALNHYAESYCEGWCKENGGLFDDCGGCKARAALTKLEEE